MITAKEARELLDSVMWNDDLQYSLDNIMDSINDACLAGNSTIQISNNTDNRILEKITVAGYKIVSPEYSSILEISW